MVDNYKSLNRTLKEAKEIAKVKVDARIAAVIAEQEAMFWVTHEFHLGDP